MRSTESDHPAGISLEALSTEELAKVLAEENAQSVKAAFAAAKQIVPVIERAAACFKAGRTVVYVGAGTSGRLGALDAAEMPPTFGVDGSRFRALVAGNAIDKSVEGAEDNLELASTDYRAIRSEIAPASLFIGISASGGAPYVLRILELAKQDGFSTAGIANNEGCELLRIVELPVFLDTGPELLAGSTRLKAGTAQKIALNTISTGAMALCGKVRGGRMTHLRPTNSKLRDRAVRIVSAELQISHEEAARRLESADWRLPVALGEAE